MTLVIPPALGVIACGGHCSNVTAQMYVPKGNNTTVGVVCCAKVDCENRHYYKGRWRMLVYASIMFAEGPAPFGAAIHGPCVVSLAHSCQSLGTHRAVR